MKRQASARSLNGHLVDEQCAVENNFLELICVLALALGSRSNYPLCWAAMKELKAEVPVYCLG